MVDAGKLALVLWGNFVHTIIPLFVVVTVILPLLFQHCDLVPAFSS
jgi:hypothetical protein